MSNKPKNPKTKQRMCSHAFCDKVEFLPSDQTLCKECTSKLHDANVYEIDFNKEESITDEDLIKELVSSIGSKQYHLQKMSKNKNGKPTWIKCHIFEQKYSHKFKGSIGAFYPYKIEERKIKYFLILKPNIELKTENLNKCVNVQSVENVKIAFGKHKKGGRGHMKITINSNNQLVKEFCIARDCDFNDPPQSSFSAICECIQMSYNAPDYRFDFRFNEIKYKIQILRTSDMQEKDVYMLSLFKPQIKQINVIKVNDSQFQFEICLKFDGGVKVNIPVTVSGFNYGSPASSTSNSDRSSNNSPEIGVNLCGKNKTNFPSISLLENDEKEHDKSSNSSPLLRDNPFDNLSSANIFGNLSSANPCDNLSSANLCDNLSSANLCDNLSGANIFGNLSSANLCDNLSSANLCDNLSSANLCDNLSSANLCDNLSSANLCDNLSSANIFGNLSSANIFGNLSSANPCDNLSSANPCDNLSSANPCDNLSSANPCDNLSSANLCDNLSSANIFGNLSSANPCDNLSSANPFDNLSSANLCDNLSSANIFDNLSSANIFGNLSSANPCDNLSSANIFGNLSSANPCDNLSSANPCDNLSSANIFGNLSSANPCDNLSSANPFDNLSSANLCDNLSSANIFGNLSSANIFGNLSSANPCDNLSSANIFGNLSSANPCDNLSSANPCDNLSSANTFDNLSSDNCIAPNCIHPVKYCGVLCEEFKIFSKDNFDFYSKNVAAINGYTSHEDKLDIALDHNQILSICVKGRPAPTMFDIKQRHDIKWIKVIAGHGDNDAEWEKHIFVEIYYEDDSKDPHCFCPVCELEKFNEWKNICNNENHQQHRHHDHHDRNDHEKRIRHDNSKKRKSDDHKDNNPANSKYRATSNATNSVTVSIEEVSNQLSKLSVSNDSTIQSNNIDYQKIKSNNDTCKEEVNAMRRKSVNQLVKEVDNLDDVSEHSNDNNNTNHVQFNSNAVPHSPHEEEYDDWILVSRDIKSMGRLNELDTTTFYNYNNNDNDNDDNNNIDANIINKVNNRSNTIDKVESPSSIDFEILDFNVVEQAKSVHKKINISDGTIQSSNVEQKKSNTDTCAQNEVDNSDNNNKKDHEDKKDNKVNIKNDRQNQSIIHFDDFANDKRKQIIENCYDNDERKKEKRYVMASKNENIKVVVRCRPVKKGKKSVLNILEGKHVRIVDTNMNKNQKVYSFDHVYEEKSSQETVYATCAKDIVAKVLLGYNGTIIAYGATGSGKTYTIDGTRSDAGLFRRACQQIFETIENKKNEITFSVKASIMEIFNEKTTCLISNKKVGIYTSKEQVAFTNLEEVICEDCNTLLNHFKTAKRNRKIGATDFNDRSSRSHLIMSIIVAQNPKDVKDEGVEAKLLMVDLAGNESHSSNMDNKTSNEGKNIRKSLLEFQTQIKWHSDPKNAKHKKPTFRNSKLTTVLKSSFGGNSKTVLIATLGPEDLKQSLSTLKYASIAEVIKNSPKKNRSNKIAELQETHREQAKQLERKEQELKKKEDKIIQMLEQSKSIRIEKQNIFKQLEKNSSAMINNDNTELNKFQIEAVENEKKLRELKHNSGFESKIIAKRQTVNVLTGKTPHVDLNIVALTEQKYKDNSKKVLVKSVKAHSKHSNDNNKRNQIKEQYNNDSRKRSRDEPKSYGCPLTSYTRTNILAKDIIYTFLATFFILFSMFDMYVGTFNKHCYKSTVSHKLVVNFGSQDDYTFLEILPYKALSYDEILSAEIPNLVPFGCYLHNGTEFGQWKIRTSLYLATYSERGPCVKNINSSLHLFLPTMDAFVEVILLNEQVANNVPQTYEKHLKELENLVNFCFQMRRTFSPSEWLALLATSISLTIGIITYKRVKTVRDKLKADWDIRISEVRNKILDREFELREALEDIRKQTVNVLTGKTPYVDLKIVALLPFQVTWPKVEILDEQRKCITTILKNYESRQDNDEIVKVIKQMYRKMVVADYRYLTSNDIEDQLSKLVRNSPRLSGDRLKFDSVSQTNELCTKTIQVINDHLHDIKVYQENYQEKSNEIHEAIHEFKEKNNNLNNEKLNLEIDLEDAQKKLMAQEVEMKEIVRFQSEFEKNLQSLEDDQKKSQEQYDRLKGGLGSLRFLNVQEIKSIPCKKWMQQVYRVQSEVTGANGSVGSPTIVVLDLKTFGEYRERIFKCSNKEEFDALDIQGVAIRIEEDKDTFDIKMAVNAKNTTLNITSKIEIVVLVVSEINIADSPNIKVFLNQVYDMIEGIKQKINDLKHKREVLKRRVPQLGAEIKDTDKAIKNLKESILSKKTQQVSLKKIHDQQIINSKTNMLEIQQNVKNLTENELYTVCGNNNNNMISNKHDHMSGADITVDKEKQTEVFGESKAKIEVKYRMKMMLNEDDHVDHQTFKQPKLNLSKSISTKRKNDYN